MNSNLLVLTCSLLIFSCSKSEEPINLGKYNDSLLCKATLSAIMGTSPKIMNSHNRNGIVTISYNRESDGKYWAYECKRDKNKLIWRSQDGRWHTHEADEKIHFKINHDNQSLKLTESYSDGSSTNHNFQYLDLI